jgi:hypothetical protein
MFSELLNGSKYQWEAVVTFNYLDDTLHKLPQPTGLKMKEEDKK